LSIDHSHSALPKPTAKRKKRNHVRKRATSERRKLEVRCRELTALLVKQRDEYTCQWCGQTQEQGFKIDAAHVLPKGTHPRMQFELINIVSLCFRCHDQRWHKESRGLPWFKEAYPDRWATIQIAQAMPRKIDLKELLIILESEVKGLENHGNLDNWRKR